MLLLFYFHKRSWAASVIVGAVGSEDTVCACWSLGFGWEQVGVLLHLRLTHEAFGDMFSGLG